MGVSINQSLFCYLVVMEVTPAEKQERRVSYNPEKEASKYFKHCGSADEVLRIAVALKANERIRNIFCVNENGVSFPKTITFQAGKFELVDNEEEVR